jgi:hypothetical protein
MNLNMYYFQIKIKIMSIIRRVRYSEVFPLKRSENFPVPQKTSAIGRCSLVEVSLYIYIYKHIIIIRTLKSINSGIECIWWTFLKCLYFPWVWNCIKFVVFVYINCIRTLNVYNIYLIRLKFMLQIMNYV